MDKALIQLAIAVGLFIRGTGWQQHIFEYRDPNELLGKSSKTEAVILATGDVMLGRSINTKMEQTKNYNYSWEKVAGYLRTADITFVNLESPLVTGCKSMSVGMVFCASPRGVEGLVQSGIDVANIANNHINNYGQTGIDETIRVLRENGIAATGRGQEAVVTIKGTRFGFLGYNDVGEEVDISDMRYEISELERKTDVVIVAMHWGIEYRTDPVERQRELGHEAIDAGADVIIGNHPHWVGAVEEYKNKWITYAHGNFVFDQNWSKETEEGVVGRYVFVGNKLVEVHFYPVIAAGDFQTRWASSAEAGKILERMKAASDKL